ncbi:HxlR family transcriptional regulator [Pseudoclavibacter endophyticus]|nr:HxlR family transcriptional regulator [Pseudoclavibacter endophyticus]
MKSYRQVCGVAGALDVIGDRWALLVVRELLIRRQARFTELQAGLPGVAPNLLTKRLRELEAHDVVVREAARGAGGVTVYRLTPRGLELDRVVRELLAWGAPTVAAMPAGSAFQMHWLSLPAATTLRDSRPQEPRVVVRFGDLADGFDVIVDAGEVHVGPCDYDAIPDTVVTGPGRPLTRLICGEVTVAGAADEGITVTGDRAALERVVPAA